MRYNLSFCRHSSDHFREKRADATHKGEKCAELRIIEVVEYLNCEVPCTPGSKKQGRREKLWFIFYPSWLWSRALGHLVFLLFDLRHRHQGKDEVLKKNNDLIFKFCAIKFILTLCVSSQGKDCGRGEWWSWMFGREEFYFAHRANHLQRRGLPWW